MLIAMTHFLQRRGTWQVLRALTTGKQYSIWRCSSRMIRQSFRNSIKKKTRSSIVQAIFWGLACTWSSFQVDHIVWKIWDVLAGKNSWEFKLWAKLVMPWKFAKKVTICSAYQRISPHYNLHTHGITSSCRKCLGFASPQCNLWSRENNRCHKQTSWASIE